jgi:hypothetical protein
MAEETTTTTTEETTVETTTTETTLSVTMHPPVKGERVIDFEAKPYVLIELDVDEAGNVLHTEIQAGSFEDLKHLGVLLHDTGNNVASIEEEDHVADGILPDSLDLTARRGAPAGVTLDLASIDAQLNARG